MKYEKGSIMNNNTSINDKSINACEACGRRIENDTSNMHGADKAERATIGRNDRGGRDGSNHCLHRIVPVSNLAGGYLRTVVRYFFIPAVLFSVLFLFSADSVLFVLLHWAFASLVVALVLVMIDLVRENNVILLRDV